MEVLGAPTSKSELPSSPRLTSATSKKLKAFHCTRISYSGHGRRRPNIRMLGPSEGRCRHVGVLGGRQFYAWDRAATKLDPPRGRASTFPRPRLSGKAPYSSWRQGTCARLPSCLGALAGLVDMTAHDLLQLKERCLRLSAIASTSKIAPTSEVGIIHKFPYIPVRLLLRPSHVVVK